jgi:hypothetical protein
VPSFSHSSLTRSSSLLSLSLLLRALIENVKKGSFSAANAEINGLLQQQEKSSRNLKARKCRGKERREQSSPNAAREPKD